MIFVLFMKLTWFMTYEHILEVVLQLLIIANFYIYATYKRLSVAAGVTIYTEDIQFLFYVRFHP